MYPISVTRSPVGEANETVQILLDDPSFVDHLRTVQHARSTAVAPRGVDGRVQADTRRRDSPWRRA